MKNHPKKAILFVPFWRMAGHVGNNRVDRFKRWLSEDGFDLVIVCAGSQESDSTEPWGGRVITVVDRLGLHPEATPDQARSASPRKPNKLRRALAYWLFNPDPAVVWAKDAARHPRVIAAMEGAQFILSSSPPDSAHVGAWMLSQRTGVPHIMDMRDGWLDEPLKPLLHTSALRRWLESRLESRIAHQAKLIQVTSDVWKELFDARYPHLAKKVHVLTNGYPAQLPSVTLNSIKRIDEEYVLIHAGRFMGSRMSQEPELLIEPLIDNIRLTPSKGVIRFYGDLSVDELCRINSYCGEFSAMNWRFDFPGPVSRAEMLEIMHSADGFLLLSAAHAALPSKMFEYIAFCKPIFVVTYKNSAVDRLCRNISNCTVFSTEKIEGVSFFKKLRDEKKPPELEDRYLGGKFLSGIK